MSRLRSRAEFARLSMKTVAGSSGAGAEEFFSLGQAAYEEGDPELAERAFRRATQLSPMSGDFHTRLAQVAYQNGRFEDARRGFAAALNIDSGNAEALLGIATALHAMGNPSEAIYYYLSYLRLEPKSTNAMTSLGTAFQSTGQVDEAVEMFERACEIEPENPQVHALYGLALYRLGRINDATSRLRRAVQLGSGDSEVHRLLSLVLLAQGDQEGARGELEKAVELDPQNIAAEIDLSTLLSDSAELDRALEHALRAVALAGRDRPANAKAASAFWQLGWVRYKLGDWRESAEASRKALELDPDLVPVRFNLGLALLRAGDVEDARIEYDKALEAVDDAWDLRTRGINPLKLALSEAPDLLTGQEMLERLEARHRELIDRSVLRTSDYRDASLERSG